ncbi:MAG: hypothetical protein IPI30_09220 [Saprospiraceae bacterium]|nr:hypothetical protein [Candidatus Vicinibacter affinis]
MKLKSVHIDDLVNPVVDQEGEHLVIGNNCPSKLTPAGFFERPDSVGGCQKLCIKSFQFRFMESLSWYPVSSRLISFGFSSSATTPSRHPPLPEDYTRN